MAVHAVQGPFTTGELGDRLVVIVQAVGRVVRSRLELHAAQVVVAAVVAGVALRVGHRRGQLVNELLWVAAGSGSVAGGTAGKTLVLRLQAWVQP